MNDKLKKIATVVSEIIFESMKYVLDDITILYGDMIGKSFKWSISIFILSILSYWLGKPMLIDYRGALLAMLFLGLLDIERGVRVYGDRIRNNSKMYEDTENTGDGEKDDSK